VRPHTRAQRGGAYCRPRVQRRWHHLRCTAVACRARVHTACSVHTTVPKRAARWSGAFRPPSRPCLAGCSLNTASCVRHTQCSSEHPARYLLLFPIFGTETMITEHELRPMHQICVQVRPPLPAWTATRRDFPTTVSLTGDTVGVFVDSTAPRLSRRPGRRTNSISATVSNATIFPGSSCREA